MDGMKTETVTTAPAMTVERPVWQKPEFTQVEIDVVTGCCYALGGNDGTPSVTSVS